MRTINGLTLAILVIPALLLVGCQGSTIVIDRMPPPPDRPALINHVVFFTLTDPADADALIADCDARLAPIPGIVSYFCGKHIDTGRASVDSNYHVGFFVGFNSEEAYAGYVDHPDHQALVADWRPKFASIMVRDVFDETE